MLMTFLCGVILVLSVAWLSLHVWNDYKIDKERFNDNVKRSKELP